MEYVNSELMAGVGVISPPRRYRDTRSRTTVRGYADTDAGRALAARGVSSVRVIHADGTEETRSVYSFRGSRSITRKAPQNPTAPQAPDVLRLAEIVGYIGNVED